MPDAVQAAANAAIAAEKKGKEKSKEIKLALKSSIAASKKKINTMWKQWSHENQQSATADDKFFPGGQSAKKFKSDPVPAKDNSIATSGVATGVAVTQDAKPVSNSSGGTLMGVIRNSGRGFHSGSIAAASDGGSSATFTDSAVGATPFRTDVSALGSYAPAAASGSGKRRFSEMPQPTASAQKEQPQIVYRDRAAERRSLYGSSAGTDDFPDIDSSKLLNNLL